MIYPFDFHTHTYLCDGKDTIEDIVKSACDKELKAIGFSGHSYTKHAQSYCMSENDTKNYTEIINNLKQKYKDKIQIYCGIEKDYYSDIDTTDFDYVIGSVHYVKKDGKYLDVDLSKDDFMNSVITYYNGSVYDFCEDYFKCVADVYNKTSCNIIGHFDLVTKFNDGNALFDEADPRYIKMALDTVDKLLKNDVIFEVNTGAVSRGYKAFAYPSRFILEHILNNGGNVILSSDAHSKENLCYDFDNAISLLKQVGFKTVKAFNGKEFFNINIF